MTSTSFNLVKKKRTGLQTCELPDVPATDRASVKPDKMKDVQSLLQFVSIGNKKFYEEFFGSLSPTSMAANTIAADYDTNEDSCSDLKY